MLSAVFGYIYVFFIQYAIPLILAYSVVMFLYGCVNYFVIGPGEEGKREEGRHELLWAMIGLLAALALYLIIAGFTWLGSWTGENVGGVDVEEDTRLQRVPDVPLRND